jgi:hypothetical protein
VAVLHLLLVAVIADPVCLMHGTLIILLCRLPGSSCHLQARRHCTKGQHAAAAQVAH